jgi:uncharacterized protein YciI
LRNPIICHLQAINSGKLVVQGPRTNGDNGINMSPWTGEDEMRHSAQVVRQGKGMNSSSTLLSSQALSR